MTDDRDAGLNARRRVRLTKPSSPESANRGDVNIGLPTTPDQRRGELQRSVHTPIAVAQDWRTGLMKWSSNNFTGNEHNVQVALRSAPELRGMIQFDEFALQVRFVFSPPWRTVSAGSFWTDDDDTALQAFLQSIQIDVRQKNTIADSVLLVAKDFSVHPVRDYFSNLAWDQTPRLATWLATYLEASSNAEYLAAVGPKFLISAVARIFEPGCKADHVLVLEGAQGISKSRAVRVLAIKSDWFTDSMPDIHSKDAALQLSGRFVVELAELAAMRRAAIEGVKAFITRSEDVYRPPYGRRSVGVPRQSVFIATTNEDHYLRDGTGNRRFWPVPCEAIDIPMLERDCDQLWAEAVVLYQRGCQWHLTDEEAALASVEQTDRVYVGERESMLIEYLELILERGEKEVCVKDLMISALGMDGDASDFSEKAGRVGPEVAQVLRRVGWRKLRTKGHGSNRRTIYRFAGELPNQTDPSGPLNLGLIGGVGGEHSKSRKSIGVVGRSYRNHLK